MKFSWDEIKRKLQWKNIPFLVSLVNWAKESTFFGFHGVPIYDVVLFIYKETKSDDITTRSNSMAFSFFLALFPTIIFLFTLLPMIPMVADYALNIRESVNGILPPASEEYIFTVVDDIVLRQRNGLLSFGLVLAVFFASNGMMSMMKGFEKSHASFFRKRHWIKKRLIAILLTVIIVFIFIISSGLIVLGHWLINFLDTIWQLDDTGIFFFNVIRWIIVLLLIYSCIAVLYRYGPAVKHRFSIFSLGTTVASALIIITSLGFSYFVTNFGKYNELYGSIGALIVTLLWFDITCFILLVGFELNASIGVNRDLKAALKADKEKKLPEKN